MACRANSLGMRGEHAIDVFRANAALSVSCEEVVARGKAADDDDVRPAVFGNFARYTHPERPRSKVPSALMRMKQQLERSIDPPLDYEGLRAAADIVREHVRKEGNTFKSGWAGQDKEHTAEMIALLHAKSRRMRERNPG